MSDPQAPVCNIEPIIDPHQPAPAQFPAIPVASDLASALRAINAMAMILRSITGQLGRTNNGGGNGGGGSGGGGRTIPPKPAPKGRWIQKTITRKNVVITDPNNPDTKITVSRVQNLTMRDTLTGEEWIYQGSDSG